MKIRLALFLTLFSAALFAGGSISPSTVSYSVKDGDEKRISITVTSQTQGTNFFAVSSDQDWLKAEGSPVVYLDYGQSSSVHFIMKPSSFMRHLQTYNATLTLKMGGATLDTTAVSMQVKPPDDSIDVSTTSVKQTISQGQSYESRSFTIYNKLDVSLPITISENSQYLSLSGGGLRIIGSRQTHKVTVRWIRINPANTGVWSSNISISPAWGDAATVSTRLTILPGVPQLLVTPTSLSDTFMRSSSGTRSKSFTVKNDGGGTLSYSISDSASWTEFSSTSGSLSAGASRTITVTYPSDMTRGVYDSSIYVSGSGSLEIVSLSVSIIDFKRNPNEEVVFLADQRLESYLTSRYDLDGNGVLTQAEANRVEALHLPGFGMVDAAGIESFVNLVYLNLEDNDLIEVPNLSDMDRLQVLNLSQNQLSGLPEMPLSLQNLTLDEANEIDLPLDDMIHLSRLMTVSEEE